MSEKVKNTVRLQINADMVPMGRKGDVLEVSVSRTGILKDRYWRRRMRDAVHDKCVEILKKGDPGFRAKAQAKAEKEAKAKAEAEAKAEKVKSGKSKATPGADEGVSSDGK